MLLLFFFPHLSLCFIDLYSLNPDLSYRTVVTEVSRFWPKSGHAFLPALFLLWRLGLIYSGFGLDLGLYVAMVTLRAPHFKFIQWHLMFSVGYVLPVFLNMCYTLIFRSSLRADLRGFFFTLLQLLQLFLSFIPSFFRLITIYWEHALYMIRQGPLYMSTWGINIFILQTFRTILTSYKNRKTL